MRLTPVRVGACNVTDTSAQLLLLQEQQTEKWFPFTKQLAFETFFEGPHCCVPDCQCYWKKVT